ncbi:PREDICTED: uncharacterized protein LOC109212417 [Nicotiana attenuata]|uniref:uncharacterized protein LOC109212417 n=1 Tax=Nicotiana attenuata TaxID=49451 RepID=UPI000904BF35|nr:PREDICTED: uncharacterized protein LOC109212417 [Nicotiana attenuata]
MANDEETERPAPNVTETLNRPIVDASSPLYMHPSDNPGIALVPVPFDGFGYRSWRRGVMRSLSVKYKLVFINGDCKRPDLDSSNYRLWERYDDMVTSWILNLLAKEIADSVEYVTDAVELWKELEDRYDQTNGTKLYQIQKEINDLSQGALDITGYYTKMKKLWEELTTLIAKSHCTCNCTCGAKENMHKAEQDRRLIQFLMGLNEEYTVVRGSILMMNPLPTIAQAFFLLIQEERQREIKLHNYLALESSALNVNTGRTTSFRTNYSPNITQNYRNRPFCDYCKRPGHTKEKCYKLHGYPQGSNQNQNPNLSYNQASNFNQNPRQNNNHGNNSGTTQGARFNRGNRGITNAHVAATDTQDAGHENCNTQNFQTGGVRDNLDNVNTLSANFAGIIACTSSIDFGKLSCECFKNKTDSWIIDSGASNNMTFNRSLVTNIIALPYPLLVILPNGYKVKVTEIGSVALTPEIILNGVMLVPSFKYNLISVHSLASHLNCLVAFIKFCCILQAPSMKRPLVIGRVKDGLYILCPRCLKNNSTGPSPSVTDFMLAPITHCTCNTQCPLHSVVNIAPHANKCVLSSSIVNSPSAGNEKQFPIENSLSNYSSSSSYMCVRDQVDVLWHNRLGHVPFVKMKNIVSLPVTFSSKQPFSCTICPMARQERLYFPQKTNTTNKILELLHIDLWGPYHVPTHEKYKYFMTIVDDFSRSTWTHLLSSKGNAYQVLKGFLNLVENQFGEKVKAVRTDNGLEFTNTETTMLLQSKGIIHQRTCPYTPQQNGVVERKYKYLLETARTLLFQSKLP